MKPRQPAPRSSSRQNFLSVVLLVSISILAFIALVQPWSLRQTTLPLEAGDVAPQDLRALSDIHYVSPLTGTGVRLSVTVIASTHRHSPRPASGSPGLVRYSLKSWFYPGNPGCLPLEMGASPLTRAIMPPARLLTSAAGRDPGMATRMKQQPAMLGRTNLCRI